MTKDAIILKDFLLRMSEERGEKSLQGYLSTFPEHLRSNILALFEELVSNEFIETYTFMTGLEWQCQIR